MLGCFCLIGPSDGIEQLNTVTLIFKFPIDSASHYMTDEKTVSKLTLLLIAFSPTGLATISNLMFGQEGKGRARLTLKDSATSLSSGPPAASV